MPSAKTSVPIEYGGRDKKMQMLVDATNKNTEDILHPYVRINEHLTGDSYKGDIYLDCRINFDIGISDPSEQYGNYDWFKQESSNVRSNKFDEDNEYEVDYNYYNFNLYAKNNVNAYGMVCRPSIGYGINGLNVGEIYKIQFTVTINDASRISSDLSDMFGVYFGEYSWMDEKYVDEYGHTAYRQLVVHSSDNPGNWDSSIGFLSFHRDQEGIPVTYDIYVRSTGSGQFKVVYSLEACLDKIGSGLPDYSSVVSITDFKCTSISQTKYKTNYVLACTEGYENGDENEDSWVKLLNPGSDIYDGIETPSINLGHDGDLYVQYSKSVLDNISISKSEEVIFSGTTPVKSSSKYAFEVYGTNEAEDEPWNPHTNLKKNKVSYVDYSITGLTPRKRYYIEGTMASKAGSVVWYENDGSPWTVDYNPEYAVIEISDPVNTLTPYKIEQNTLTYRYYVTYNESYDFNFEFVPSGTSMTFRIYTEGFSRAEGVVSGFNVTDFRSIGYANAKIYAKIKGDWIEVVSGGGGGSSDSITPVLTSGTKIADFDIGGNTGSLYAPSGGGGGSTVVIDPISFQDGTPIATFSINGVQGTIYIPDIPIVKANPSSNPSQTLTKLSIDDVVYDIPGEETEYVPLIPAMISSSDPSGTVTDSSDIGGSYVAWKAFDDDTATGWVGSSSDYTPWIQYEWSTPQVFHKLYLDLYNPDTTTTLTRTLTIQGLLSDGTYENCLLSGNSLAVEFKKNAHTKYEVHLNGQSYEAIKITSSDRSYLGENSPECRFCEIQVYQNLLPKGTVVIANPSGQATEDLTKIQIGTDIYNIVGGGSNYSETFLYTGTTPSTTINLSDSFLNYDALLFTTGFDYSVYTYLVSTIISKADLQTAMTNGYMVTMGYSANNYCFGIPTANNEFTDCYSDGYLFSVKGIKYGSASSGGGGVAYGYTNPTDTASDGSVYILLDENDKKQGTFLYMTNQWMLIEGRPYVAETKLYDNGTENVAWELGSANDGIKNSNNISLNVGAGNYSHYAITTNAVDVTNYDTLNVQCRYRGQDYDMDLDISSYTGDMYISFTYLTDNSHNEVAVGLSATKVSSTTLRIDSRNGSTAEAILYYMSLK